MFHKLEKRGSAFLPLLFFVDGFVFRLIFSSDVLICERLTEFSLYLDKPFGLRPKVHGVNCRQIITKFTNLVQFVEVTADLFRNFALDIDTWLEKDSVETWSHPNLNNSTFTRLSSMLKSENTRFIK